MVIALGLVAATAGGAQAAAITSTTAEASPLLAYDTVNSSIGTTGITGTPVINFIPATGSVMAPSNMSFGKFEIVAPPSGSTTTYSNTPFSIKITPDAVNGSAPGPNLTPLTVTGLLNGTVYSDSRTDVVATFNPMTQSTFQTGLYVNTLGLPNSPLSLVPSTINNGDTTLQASITSAVAPAPPVPEPSTLALFAATIVGLGFRRRILARRAASV
jgi:hypothetical protein